MQVVKDLEEQRMSSSPEATLQVPYSIDSKCKSMIQAAEDAYSSMMGCKRINVVEAGGSKLINVLGKNNPWESQMYCTDNSCVTCTLRAWLKEQEKTAKQNGTSMPKFTLKVGSTLCRREGVNYSLKCLLCLETGVDSRYQGVSSRLSCQRHGEHQAAVDTGLVSNPMVLHSVEQHGGTMPRFIATINRVDPRALYRACRESVQIANQPNGPRNIN